jgi:hypothetical protein
MTGIAPGIFQGAVIIVRLDLRNYSSYNAHTLV